MARRKRLTRNAYKRKIIVFGVLIFLAIGFISTGFATWMMSSSAKSESSGNVNVGLIKAANIEFESIELYKKELVYDATVKDFVETETLVTTLADDLEGFYFSFDPLISDVSGRVHYGESEYGPESLWMRIKGVIGPIEVLKDVSIELSLPESVNKAVNKGYIKLPDVATKQIVFTYGNGLSLVEGSDSLLEFNYEYQFEWGSAFNHQNPGLYYDLDEAGKNVPMTKVQETLLDLRACVYGYDEELAEIYDLHNNGEIGDAEFNDRINRLQENTTFQPPKFKLTIIGNIK